MSQEKFSENDVNAISVKIAEFGSTLNDNERKLLDLLIAAASRPTIIASEEILDNINLDLKISSKNALSRFVNSNSTIIKDDYSPTCGWKR